MELAAVPPPEIFDKVSYPAPLGKNEAYVSPVRKGFKRPAIVWIHGGFDWGISEFFWKKASPENDQTAAAFRDMDLVLMLPSLRGTNANPGSKEYFLGEVDDVIAAADFLAKREDVDPDRIYLGGHSTGGTLALLVAESTARFRAVFAFGPISHVLYYGDDWASFDMNDKAEREIRSPLHYMDSIATPTFVMEGSDGNIGVFPAMRVLAKGAPVHFIPLFGATHFNALGSMSALIARKIQSDTGARCSIAFSDSEIDNLMIKLQH